MKLLAEVRDELEYMVEDVNGEKSHFLEGVFMQGNIVNANKRMYPTSVLAGAVRAYNEQYVSKRRAFGELGHPEGPTVNLDRVSHMITSLVVEGDNVIGKAKIMDTPNGRIVKELMKEGASLGVSSRGVGSVRESGGHRVVQPDFLIATAADIVANPSAPNAFVENIMEGAEWIFDAATSSWREVDQLREQMIRMSAKKIEDNKMRLFEQFMETINRRA